MNAQKQFGKGLMGFLFGLLLAAAIIVGILFSLNKNAPQTIKEPAAPEQVEEHKQTEPEPAPPAPQDVPDQTGVNVADDSIASEATIPATQPEDVPEQKNEEIIPVPAVVPKTDVSTEHKAKAHVDREESANVEVDEHSTDKAQDKGLADKKAVQKEAEAKRKETLKKKRAEAAEKASTEQGKSADSNKKVDQLTDKQKARAERKLAEKKAANKAKEAKKSDDVKVIKPSKPTPEEILNSGSIEKARADNAKNAKRDYLKAKADSKESRVEKPVSSPDAKGGKVIVQMGSYGNRTAADSQQAKLAMMGVQARIVEGSANGKTIYRVQSGVMSQEAAKRAQHILQKNGVNSFTRSVQ